MGFTVVEHEIRNIWAPVNFANSSDTLYEGQIVGTPNSSSVPAIHPIRHARHRTERNNFPCGVAMACRRRHRN